MFSFPGIIALVFFFFVRPQEFYTVLQQLPLLYIFTALAVFGMVIDLKLRLVRPEPTPQLAWVLLFFVWAAGSAMLKNPEPIKALTELAILFTWYFLISHGLQSFRAYETMVRVVLLLAVFLSVVGLHQYFSPLGCVAIEPDVALSVVSGTPDGRSCRQPLDCAGRGAEPGKEYLCEHIGLLGTTSITGRIRYRGTLHDPNELALVVAATLPFVFAFVGNRRSALRLSIGLLALALIVGCVLVTQSRGGLLVIAAVIGTYVIRRYRFAAVAGGTVMLSVLMALATRGRADTSASSAERIECWWEGMTMFRYHPLTGVGFDQFIEHHYLTAHNSFILTAAELGVVGMFLFMAVIYTSFKIPLMAYRRYPERPRPRRWAMATLAAFIGMMVGAFFLSLTYRYMLWTYIALAGAFYRAIKAHDPEWRLRFGVADFAAVSVLTVSMLGGLYLMTRLWPPAYA